MRAKMQKTYINTRICQLIFIIFSHDKKEKNFKKFTFIIYYIIDM